MTELLLEVDDLRASYGQIEVLHGMSFSVAVRTNRSGRLKIALRKSTGPLIGPKSRSTWIGLP